MVAQFMHRRMIVTGHLIGQRQIGRVENAGFGAEILQQACGLFGTLFLFAF